jgi:hypothetical protein
VPKDTIGTDDRHLVLGNIAQEHFNVASVGHAPSFISRIFRKPTDFIDLPRRRFPVSASGAARIPMPNQHRAAFRAGRAMCFSKLSR